MIKARRLRFGLKGEYRKVAINNDDLNLSELELMAQRIFKLASTDVIKFTYKDEDDVMVTVGDDTELKLAMEDFEQIRLIITLANEQDDGNNSPNVSASEGKNESIREFDPLSQPSFPQQSNSQAAGPPESPPSMDQQQPPFNVGGPLSPPQPSQHLPPLPQAGPPQHQLPPPPPPQHIQQQPLPHQFEGPPPPPPPQPQHPPHQHPPHQHAPHQHPPPQHPPPQHPPPQQHPQQQQQQIGPPPPPPQQQQQMGPPSSSQPDQQQQPPPPPQYIRHPLPPPVWPVGNGYFPQVSGYDPRTPGNPYSARKRNPYS